MPEAHLLLLQIVGIQAFEETVACRHLPPEVSAPFYAHREALIKRWSEAQKADPCNCTKCL